MQAGEVDPAVTHDAAEDDVGAVPEHARTEHVERPHW